MFPDVFKARFPSRILSKCDVTEENFIASNVEFSHLIKNSTPSKIFVYFSCLLSSKLLKSKTETHFVEQNFLWKSCHVISVRMIEQLDR
jgi:hypothetical protein